MLPVLKYLKKKDRDAHTQWVISNLACACASLKHMHKLNSCKTFHMNELLCEDSFWQRGKKELGNDNRLLISSHLWNFPFTWFAQFSYYYSLKLQCFCSNQCRGITSWVLSWKWPLEGLHFGQWLWVTWSEMKSVNRSLPFVSDTLQKSLDREGPEKAVQELQSQHREG